MLINNSELKNYELDKRALLKGYAPLKRELIKYFFKSYMCSFKVVIL